MGTRLLRKGSRSIAPINTFGVSYVSSEGKKQKHKIEKNEKKIVRKEKKLNLKF